MVSEVEPAADDLAVEPKEDVESPEAEDVEDVEEDALAAAREEISNLKLLLVPFAIEVDPGLSSDQTTTLTVLVRCIREARAALE